MKVKSIYFVLLFSLGFFSFSLPSSAVTTLKNVLNDQSLEKLEKYVSTLEVEHIPEIRHAVEWIDWKDDESIYWSRARAILLKRLQELEQEEDSASHHFGTQAQEDRAPRYAGAGSGGGGGGHDYGDGRPFLPGSGPSASSVFARPASPWNSPQAFMQEWGLSDKLTEMLGPKRLDLTAPRPRVPDMAKVVSFRPLHFLEQAKQKLKSLRLKAEITGFLENKNRDHSKTIDLCWRALAKLKAEMILSENLEDLPYVYMAMAKMLLATQMLPSFEISGEVRIHDTESTPQETYNRLNSYLRGRIADFNIEKRREKKDLIYKWSLLYHALLNMESVKRNPGREDNVRRLADANNFLNEAGRLKTTKSAHVFLAHLYLEHGHLLGFDNKEIDALVAKELDLFYTNKAEGGDKPSRKRALREAQSFWSVVSQPPYFRDNEVQQDVSRLLELVLQQQPVPQEQQELPEVVVTQADPEAAAMLPARNIDVGYLLERRESYTIQGGNFANYNVSGRDFRCFFNSIGLNASEQIRLLLRNQDEPRVRAIIANEIVSSWHQFYQLQQPVRAALNARDLLERQARVDRLVASESQQDLRVELQTEQEAILKELRRRASSIPVFQTFVQSQIGTRIDGDQQAPYPMMVMQQDVSGEEENELPNLAAIDAIALLNRIGLRIFQIAEGELRPVHTYIPPEATTVAHLIYSAEEQHFTALVPIDEVMDAEEDSNQEQLDAQIQDAYEEAIHQGTVTENLSLLLRERFPDIENSSMQTDDEVRLILFLNSQGLEHGNIAKQPLVHLSRSRVGTLLNENGIRRHHAYDADTIDQIFDAYLSTGYGIKGRGYAFSEITGPIADALGLDRRKLKTFFDNISSSRHIVLRTRGPLTVEERSEIVNLYRERPSFFQIAWSMRLPLLLILEVLNEDLPQEARPTIIDPSKVVRREPVEERNKKIVEAFHRLRDLKGNAPTASDVARHSGYTMKIVLKVLKEAGLMEGTTKSKHLSEDLIGKIRAQWVARGWDVAPGKEQHQREIAEEFGVSPIQVIALIAGRSYHKDTGEKRKRQVTAQEIQAAYADLSPEEQPNALAILGRLLNCMERQVAEALQAIGVNLGTQKGGSKKARKE